MAKVRALRVLKDAAGYHEPGDVFDANQADADRWVERGTAETVRGRPSKASGKGSQSDSHSGPQAGDSGSGEGESDEGESDEEVTE